MQGGGGGFTHLAQLGSGLSERIGGYIDYISIESATGACELDIPGVGTFVLSDPGGWAFRLPVPVNSITVKDTSGNSNNVRFQFSAGVEVIDRRSAVAGNVNTIALVPDTITAPAAVSVTTTVSKKHDATTDEGVITFANVSGTTAFYGKDNTVTAANGMPLYVGQTVPLSSKSDWYFITATGTADVRKLAATRAA